MSKKRPTDPPVRQILGADQIDDLGHAIITLTRELWVVTDRLMIVEKLLEDNGIPAGAIDNYQPDAEMEQKLSARREKLINAVLSALKAKSED